MMALDIVVPAVSPYVTAAFGLVGSLIGGTIAGTVSILVARQTRDAAARSWMRDSRRQIYDRFLTRAQELLIACEACEYGTRTPEAEEAVKDAFSTFFEAYGVVQTVAERPVVDAARVQAYRLLQLRFEVLGSGPTLGPQSFEGVARLIRSARHATIDAMRAELGLGGSARPPDDFNPFEGTELEDRYRQATA